MMFQDMNPLIPGLLGLSSGVLLAMLKDRLDLRARCREAASALSLFCDLLVASMRRRESGNASVISIDEMTRRLIQCRFGELHGWPDYLLVCEKYSIWLIGGFVDASDIEEQVNSLQAATDRIVVKLREK